MPSFLEPLGQRSRQKVATHLCREAAGQGLRSEEGRLQCGLMAFPSARCHDAAVPELRVFCGTSGGKGYVEIGKTVRKQKLSFPTLESAREAGKVAIELLAVAQRSRGRGWVNPGWVNPEEGFRQVEEEWLATMLTGNSDGEFKVASKKEKKARKKLVEATWCSGPDYTEGRCDRHSLTSISLRLVIREEPNCGRTSRGLDAGEKCLDGERHDLVKRLPKRPALLTDLWAFCGLVHRAIPSVGCILSTSMT